MPFDYNILLDMVGVGQDVSWKYSIKMVHYESAICVSDKEFFTATKFVGCVLELLHEVL